jgi:microcystin-dependent protein
MSEPYLGQIIPTAFGFAPKAYAHCDRQLLPINQNQALFSLLGLVYGGNGSTNFALPDMRGRAGVGAGPSANTSWQPSPVSQGSAFGAETVTLNVQQLPIHNHLVLGSSAPGGEASPAAGQTFAMSTPAVYGSPGQPVALQPGPTTTAGGNVPHPNMQPTTTLSMSIALFGIWPQRN